MKREIKKEIKAYGIKVLLSPHPAIRRLKRLFTPNHHGNRFWWSSWLLMDYFKKNGIPKGSRILEIGCGWGLLSIYCAKKHKAVVTGADLDRNVLPYGMLHANINNVNVDFIQKGFEHITQKELKNYDIILGADICFWDDMTRLLKNLILKAKRAGVKQVYISDPIRSPFENLCEYFNEERGGEVLDWIAPEPREILGQILKISL
jgi:2-polyprenyl-3-methyl-5-hydroxy-6-metoxy-1,4-benzoquinol methylase